MRGPESRSSAARWRGVHRSLAREHAFVPLEIDGTIPPGIVGTYYANGPSLFESPSGSYQHAFDGDGALAAVRVADGCAHGAVRVLVTPWLAKERTAGRQLYRGYDEMGRGLRRWFTLPKNPANVSVMATRGRLFALWEAGLPVEVDPATLAVVGPSTLGGRIGPTFSAHPHAEGGETFNFGVRYGARFALDVHHVGWSRLARVPLRFPTLIHDFAVTKSAFVFVAPPVRLRLARLLGGIGCFDENLAWEPSRGAEVILIPRAEGGAVTRFEVPPFFAWHLVNAWDEPDGVVVELIRYDDFTTNAWFGRAPWEVGPPPRSTLARYHIARDRRAIEPVAELTLDCEFPGIHPDEVACPHTRTWVVAWAADGRPTLARVDIERGDIARVELGTETAASEPTIVKDAGGHAYAISIVYDGATNRSACVIVDERSLDVVARAWFPGAIPYRYHGKWVPH